MSLLLSFADSPHCSSPVSFLLEAAASYSGMVGRVWTSSFCWPGGWEVVGGVHMLKVIGIH